MSYKHGYVYLGDMLYFEYDLTTWVVGVSFSWGYWDKSIKVLCLIVGWEDKKILR